MPLMLMNVVDDDVAFPFLHILASVLAWASAVINPFIYAFKNKQYQQAFAKVYFVSSSLLCVHLFFEIFLHARKSINCMSISST